MQTFVYDKPELWDFDCSARGDGEEDAGSCFTECASDSICPGVDDEI